MKHYPFTRQETIKDCGAACISMIVKYYHGYIPLIKLRGMLKINQNGTTAYHILETLKSLGFKANCKRETLIKTQVPFIAHTIIDKKLYHFVVIYKVNDKEVIIADPISKVKKMKIADFKKIWTGIKIEMYPIKPMPRETMVKRSKIIKTLPIKTILVKVLPLTIIIIITSVINTFFFALTIENIKLGLLFLILTLINIISNYYCNKNIINIIHKVISKIRFNTYKSIIKLPYEYYENYKTGEMLSYLNEISILEKFYISFIMTITTNIPLLLISVFTLYIINKLILKLYLLVITLYIIVSILYNKITKEKIEKVQSTSVQMNAYMQETITNYSTIKGINIENKIIKLFSSKQHNAIKENLQLSNFFNKQYLIKNMILDITKILIIIYGIYLYKQNVILLNNLITVVMLINLMQNAIKSITELNINYKEASQTFIKLEELNINENKKVINKTTQIEIKNLSHTFDETTKSLSNINLKINSGEKILITGKSGSGKSTLFKILKGYYQYQGQILINGKDFKNNIPKVTYVTCQKSIFTGTINQNIILKDKNKLEEIKNICYLNDIVKDKELGFNTLIEEDGNNISDGQRQRIVLARALQNFDILIIDESINATDINLERKILKQLFKHYPSKTIIFITHRLDNLDLFNRYIVMDNGKIILDEKHNK